MFVYLCRCERTGVDRGRLGGVKHVLRMVNARVCVAENQVPVDLLHHQRHKEMRDGDAGCKIWMWVTKDRKNLDFVSEYGERDQC